MFRRGAASPADLGTRFFRPALLLSLLLPLLPAHAFPFDRNGCASGACADCHQLSPEEAAALLGGRADRVLSVAPSEVPGAD